MNGRCSTVEPLHHNEFWIPSSQICWPSHARSGGYYATRPLIMVPECSRKRLEDSFFILSYQKPLWSIRCGVFRSVIFLSLGSELAEPLLDMESLADVLRKLMVCPKSFVSTTSPHWKEKKFIVPKPQLLSCTFQWNTHGHCAFGVIVAAKKKQHVE